MRLEIKRSALLIVPESDQDNAYLEETLGIKTGEEVKVAKVTDIKMGFSQNDSWVLKIEKK